MTELCSDCNGRGHLGRAKDGRLIACESCGGHEDALGTGVEPGSSAEDMAADLARIEAELDDQRALNRNLAATTAKVIEERDRYRQALVEINEKSTLSLHHAGNAPGWIRTMFSSLASIATAALKEKDND